MTHLRTNERRSWLTRFALHPDGELRGWRILGVSAAGAFLLAIGGAVAAVLSGTGTVAALPMYTIIGFIVIKLPLLALLWWVLGRRRMQDADQMDAAQASVAVDRLRAAADAAGREVDAWDRLDGLAAEARFVATHSPPEVAERARELADDLTARRDRRRAPTPAAR